MNKRKKVCIDVNSIVPLYVFGYLSGVGRTTLELVEALARIKDELPFGMVLYSQNMKGVGGRNLTDVPFQKKHLYLPHREQYDKLLQYFPVRELLTAYDLLHIPHNFEYVLHPHKTVITLHDTLFMKMQEKLFEHDKMVQVIPPLMRKVKKIITCSGYSKKDIVETMNVPDEKITVIPWGVKHDLFYPVSTEEKRTVSFSLKNKFHLNKPYFLAVSCNEERKNTPRLIDCYIQLAQTNPINDLCLIWDAPEHIRNKVKNSGFAHRIHFIHHVPDADLRLLYLGATATIYPSLYEGFGLPILESMACGTPVICSNTTSLPEVGGDAAIYVNPLDSQSIIDALNAFEKQDYNRLFLIEKGINQAAKYTWQRCAHETAAIYETLLNSIR